MEHIKSQHSDTNERPANQSGISSKASTVKDLDEQCVIGFSEYLMPFSFVEDTSARMYCNKPICVDTLQTNIEKKVEKVISRNLPAEFLLIFDGWTNGPTHYAEIASNFIHIDSKNTVLLAF